MRFVISLKRAANPDGGQEWRLEHFSSAKFDSGPSSMSSSTQVSIDCEHIEMDPLEPPNDTLKTYGP